MGGPTTRNAHSSVVSALQNLSDLLRRRSCEDLLRRSRVAQRHLWEEVEVFLANPGEAGHAQMVREACGELRKAAAEVLEMIHESINAEAAEVAQYWQVVLSAYRLVLWATALADGNNAALRAAQALQNILAPLGQFFWQHLATGQEPWLLALERQRVHFLPQADRLFTCLGLDPGSLEIRLSLACHFALGSPSLSRLSLPVASHQWLERLDDEFLQGLHHMLQGDLDVATERWNHLASGRDLAPGLRQLELPEDIWCALARGARPPLMEALLAAQRLPAPAQRELQDAAEADAEAGTAREPERPVESAQN
eukprot:s1276_g9.t3